MLQSLLLCTFLERGCETANDLLGDHQSFNTQMLQSLVDERRLCHLGSGTHQWYHPVETHYDSVVVQPEMIIIVQVAKKYLKSSWVWNPRSLWWWTISSVICVFPGATLDILGELSGPKISSTNILSPKRKILCKYKCMTKKTEISKNFYKRTKKSHEPQS